MISKIKALGERWIYNPRATPIVQSLMRRPDQWVQGVYTISHESGLEVWTANGYWFVGIQRPVQEKLGLVGRHRVAFAIAKWHRDRNRRVAASQRFQAQLQNQLKVDQINDALQEQA